jgi:hypothetical protein
MGVKLLYPVKAEGNDRRWEMTSGSQLSVRGMATGELGWLVHRNGPSAQQLRRRGLRIGDGLQPDLAQRGEVGRPKLRWNLKEKGEDLGWDLVQIGFTYS